jgi:hypothetical protein
MSRVKIHPVKLGLNRLLEVTVYKIQKLPKILENL